MSKPFFFKGSETVDIKSDTENHPFTPCPSSPNCIVVSKLFSQGSEDIFSAAQKALDIMNPLQMEVNSQSLQINAVFQIPVFLFKDDLEVIVTEGKSSFLHVKSSSRVGHGDLGVNRRRVHKLLSLVNQHLKI